jgi:hypothetical protein
MYIDPLSPGLWRLNNFLVLQAGFHSILGSDIARDTAFTSRWDLPPAYVTLLVLFL